MLTLTLTNIDGWIVVSPPIHTYSPHTLTHTHTLKTSLSLPTSSKGITHSVEAPDGQSGRTIAVGKVTRRVSNSGVCDHTPLLFVMSVEWGLCLPRAGYQRWAGNYWCQASQMEGQQTHWLPNIGNSAPVVPNSTYAKINLPKNTDLLGLEGPPLLATGMLAALVHVCASHEVT